MVALGLDARVCIAGVALALGATACLLPFPPKPASEEELACIDACDAALLPADAGCFGLCGIDVGNGHENDPGGAVVGLGGDCEILVSCGSGVCQDQYLECLRDSGDLLLCGESYSLCAQDLVCSGPRSECDAAAETAYDLCVDAGGLACEEALRDAQLSCDCAYEDCMGIIGTECAEGAMLLAPPPVQTGPQRWTITRRLIDQQLARLGRLEAQTAIWPVANTARTQWRGLRLSSVEPGTPLHQAGLRNGDLLRLVNGVRVTELMRDVPAQRALRAAATIVVELDRAGVARQHQYQIIP